MSELINEVNTEQEVIYQEEELENVVEPEPKAKAKRAPRKI